MSGAQASSHVDQAEVCDDGSAVLQKNVFSFEIFVDNALVVEVAHALRDLLGDDDDFVHVKFIFSQMQVSVEGVALAQGGHYGQFGWLHAGAHEEDQVLVTGFPVNKDLNSQRLQLASQLT